MKVTENLHGTNYTVSYEAEVTGGWFADIRDKKGQRVETGLGPTREKALEHACGRLERHQDPVTLDDLADIVSGLAEQVQALATRPSAPEAALTGQHVKITVTCDNGHIIGTWDDTIEEKYPFWCEECAEDKRTVKHPWKLTTEIIGADGLLALLGEGSTVTFGRDAEDGSFFADVMTGSGMQLSGTGDTPAAALKSARDTQDDQEPYCATCGADLGIFHGHGDGWHHYRGEGTAASPVELFDAEHAPAVAWREAGDAR
jgi:hypothetical protein